MGRPNVEEGEGRVDAPTCRGSPEGLGGSCSPCAICTSTATPHAPALLPAPQSHTGEINVVSTDRSCLKGLCGAPTSTLSPATPSQSPTPQHALS